MQKLVLASSSPRRKELLERAGFQFTVSSIQISEIPDENLNLPDQIEDLAAKKALACLNSGKLPKGLGYLILSSDTVVVLAGQILGKPENRSENEQMLRALSGRKHNVITSVCLLDVDSGLKALDHATSEIEFRELSHEEIRSYIASGDGLDKAGGYGIQGAAGKFVKSFTGDMDTIIGLPLALVQKLLLEKNWHVDQRKS